MPVWRGFCPGCGEQAGHYLPRIQSVSEKHINVDIIIQSVTEPGKKDIFLYRCQDRLK